MLMLKVVQATSIDSKGKMDIMTTGMESIIRQHLPEDTETEEKDMSFIDGWLDDNEESDSNSHPTKQNKMSENGVKIRLYKMHENSSFPLLN